MVISNRKICFVKSEAVHIDDNSAESVAAYVRRHYNPPVTIPSNMVMGEDMYIAAIINRYHDLQLASAKLNIAVKKYEKFVAEKQLSR